MAPDTHRRAVECVARDVRDREPLLGERRGSVDELLFGAPGDGDDRTVARERTRAPESDA